MEPCGEMIEKWEKLWEMGDKLEESGRMENDEREGDPLR